MAGDYIQNLFAERIGGSKFGVDTPVYKFERIKRAKRRFLQEHPDTELLDFGIGEPDKRPPIKIIDELHRTAHILPKHGYTDTGTEKFKQAISKYMRSYYGVDVDPETEVLPTIGTKEALANFPKVMINPGDVALVTVPGYPVLGTNTGYLDGKIYNIPLRKERNFLPDLESIPEDTRKMAKILYLNYPNNPTGAVANKDFYEEVIDFAKDNKLVVVQDAAYAALVYNSEPLSFLSVDGAKDVGIEVHSFSKSYNMTGWRLGFAVGNSLLIKGLATIKDNTDSGSFEAIQEAGIRAMDNPHFTKKIVQIYSRRLDLVVNALNNVGLEAEKPGGTFYLYVQIPRGNKDRIFADAEEFSQYLITEKGIVTVPWDDVGNYVRFSATFNARNKKEGVRIAAALEERLADAGFYFG